MLIDNTIVKTVKLKLEHDEAERVIFRGFRASKGKWFSKMCNGDWYYTCSPMNYYELSHKMQVPYQFIICDNENETEYAIDSSIPELATKPFVPIRDIEKQLREQYLQEEGNIAYEEWVEIILDAMHTQQGFVYDAKRRDSYIYDSTALLDAKIISSTEYAGRQRNVKQETWLHAGTGIKYVSYTLDIDGANHDLLVYKIL